MKYTLGLSAALCSAIWLSGCANLQSIHRINTINPNGQTEVVGAKQRLIISVPNFHEKGESIGDGDPAFRICAEAAPDVFSISALGFSGEASQGISGQFGAALGLSSAETGATIERTQTINLMRESMYRTCERYMNGGITKDTLVTQAARDQRAMIAFLAIEQLTGIVKRQPTILSSSTEATLISANKPLIDLRVQESEAVEKAKKAADAAKLDADAKQSSFSQLHAGKCETILSTPDPEVPLTQTAPEQKTTEKTELPSGETTTVTVEPVETNVPDTSAKDEADAFIAKKTECKSAQTLVENTKATLETQKEAVKSAEKALSETTELLKSLGYNSLTAKASGSGTGDSGSQSRTFADVIAVAAVVESITRSAFSDQSEIVFACTNILTDPSIRAPAILESCLRIIERQAVANIDRLEKSDDRLSAVFNEIDQMIANGDFDQPDSTISTDIPAPASRVKLSDTEKRQLEELENQFSKCLLTQSIVDTHPELRNFFNAEGKLSLQTLTLGPIDGWGQGDEISSLHASCESQLKG